MLPPFSAASLHSVTTQKTTTYKGVSKSFWTDLLGQELQMVQLSATRHGCIAFVWVSLVSFPFVLLLKECLLL